VHDSHADVILVGDLHVDRLARRGGRAAASKASLRMGTSCESPKDEGGKPEEYQGIYFPTEVSQPGMKEKGGEKISG